MKMLVTAMAIAASVVLVSMAKVKSESCWII